MKGDLAPPPFSEQLVPDVPPSFRCEKCRRWSAGAQRHPHAPAGMWGLCLHGEPGWSHRDYGCASFVRAPRIKAQKAEQMDLLEATE